MKKQTKKKTAAKCCAAKSRQAKSVVKPKAKSAAKPVPKPQAKSKSKSAVKPVAKTKTKPAVAAPSAVAKTKAKPKNPKPVVSPPPVVEPVVQSIPVTALPAPVAKPDNPSEMDELRRIELALADAENAVAGVAVSAVKPIPSGLTAEITELLDELIVNASPRSVSTVSRLAYVLCGVMPGLQAVSERADIVLCRKNGVTFGWDRHAEEERAVLSGKRQKSIRVA